MTRLTLAVGSRVGLDEGDVDGAAEGLVCLKERTKHEINESTSRRKDTSTVFINLTEIALTVGTAGAFVGPREGDFDGTPVRLTWKDSSFEVRLLTQMELPNSEMFKLINLQWAIELNQMRSSLQYELTNPSSTKGQREVY